MACAPGPLYPDITCAVRDYLKSQSFYILGQGEVEIPGYTQEFPPDGEDTGFFVREVGGSAWLDLPLNDMSVEIFVRDPSPKISKLLLSRIYSLLNKFQGELNSEVYAMSSRATTGKQRLDDLDNAHLAQNSMIFDMIVRLV